MLENLWSKNIYVKDILCVFPLFENYKPNEFLMCVQLRVYRISGFNNDKLLRLIAKSCVGPKDKLIESCWTFSLVLSFS